MKLPTELTERNQWVLWRYEERPGTSKLTKRPYTCMGYEASNTKPQDWSSFAYALNMSRRPGFAAGVGFVFAADDPFCGIDCDNAWPSDAAEMSPWAAGIEEHFADTYREQSPSETGFKIFCRARAPRCGKWDVAASGRIEIYDRARFFTVTGCADDAVPRVLTDHQVDIEALVAHLSRLSKFQSASQLPKRITEGSRHPALVSLAGTMRRRGAGFEVIESALLAFNRTQCTPPKSEEEVRKIAQSAMRWPG